MCGVLRVAAAVVEEVADVVRLENIHETPVLRGVVLKRCELVPARAECATRRAAKLGDGLGRFLVRIDQVLPQRPQNAVAAGVHVADPVAVRTSGFDHAAGGGVDDGGDTAGLSVEGVAAGHFGSVGELA